VIRRATVADAAGIARVQVDGWRAAYRGLVPQAHLDGLSYADREQRWAAIAANPEQATFVALAGEVVVGFGNGGARHSQRLDSDGELYALYVWPGRWRSGFGRRLIGAVAAELAARGSVGLGVWVLRDNAAGCRFYAALGGQRSVEAETFIGGACLTKVAYLWPSLEPLLVGRGDR
jgi:GNAT superfamily N-acetyltransferase